MNVGILKEEVCAMFAFDSIRGFLHSSIRGPDKRNHFIHEIVD